LEAVPTFESKIAKVGADLELAEMRCAELERRERETTIEVAELRKALEESKVKISVLETEKASIEAEIDKIQDDTLVMLGGTFDQVVRQTRPLYNGPQPVGTFDVNIDVHEGRLVPFDELQALKNAAPGPSAKDIEDEDH